jgi:hypothetical protein
MHKSRSQRKKKDFDTMVPFMSGPFGGSVITWFYRGVTQYATTICWQMYYLVSHGLSTENASKFVNN